jgi:acetyl esterase
MKKGYFISEPVISFFLHSYLQGKDLVTLLADRRVSPLTAGLKGLPPVTLISAEEDPLVDELHVLADALTEEGVRCTHHHFQGVTHGFATFHFLPDAKECHDKLLRDLEHLEGGAAPA